MKIEKVIRFIRAVNGVSGDHSVAGPRLTTVSLPRVRFIEGDAVAEKYFLPNELSPNTIARITNVPMDKVLSFLGRKDKSDDD